MAHSQFAEAFHATPLLVAAALALQFLHSSAVGSPPQMPQRPPPPLAVSPPRRWCPAPWGATRSRRSWGRRTSPWARARQRREPAPPFRGCGRCRAKSGSCCWELASRRPTCRCSSAALPGTRGAWSPWTLFAPPASWAAMTLESLPRLNTHCSALLSGNLFRRMLLSRGRKSSWGCVVQVSGFWVCVGENGGTHIYIYIVFCEERGLRRLDHVRGYDAHTLMHTTRYRWATPATSPRHSLL